STPSSNAPHRAAHPAPAHHRRTRHTGPRRLAPSAMAPPQGFDPPCPSVQHHQPHGALRAEETHPSPGHQLPAPAACPSRCGGHPHSEPGADRSALFDCEVAVHSRTVHVTSCDHMTECSMPVRSTPEFRVQSHTGRGFVRMAWDEWEQIKAEVAQKQATSMQLNRVAPDPGHGGGGAAPDLVVHDDQLGKLGNMAYDLRERLRVDGDLARPSTFKASIDLFNDGLDM